MIDKPARGAAPCQPVLQTAAISNLTCPERLWLLSACLCLLEILPVCFFFLEAGCGSGLTCALFLPAVDDSSRGMAAVPSGSDPQELQRWELRLRAGQRPRGGWGWGGERWVEAAGVPAGPCLAPAPAFGPLFPAAAPLGPGPAGSHTQWSRGEAGEGGRKLSPELLCPCGALNIGICWLRRWLPPLASAWECKALRATSKKNRRAPRPGCSTLLLHGYSLPQTSQKYPHSYKQHRNASPKLLLKCLLRSNFRTTDRNTTAREVE